MPDLPKQELDELFREGAGMQTFEYNEAAWNKMEVMLDAGDRNRKIGMWLLLLLGLVLAIMVGSWSLNTENADIADNRVYAVEDSSISSTEESIVKAEVKTPVALESEIVVENTPIETVVTLNTAEQSTINTAITNNKPYSSNNNIVAYNSSSNSGKSTPSDNTAETSVGESTNIISLKTSEKSVADIQNNVIINALVEIEKLQQHNIARLEAYNELLDNSQSQLAVTLADYEDDNNKPSIASKLSYTIYVAPEWSSVGINGAKEMGYKFGAKFGYQIGEKWELSTGVALSKKEFNGRGSQFTEAGGWIDDIMPMTMEGKCNVIEIPLDVVYHFSGVGNTGFVASAGLRSYMLHSEWYGFEYDVWKPGLLEEKITDNENKNWVGSMELSLGYSKKVSNNLSVQITPYLQIPLTGIGEGKVNLYSGGVQFAARFDSK